MFLPLRLSCNLLIDCLQLEVSIFRKNDYIQHDCSSSGRMQQAAPRARLSTLRLVPVASNTHVCVDALKVFLEQIVQSIE